MHWCTRTPNKRSRTSNKLLYLALGHVVNYIDMRLYLRILGWTNIYDFSSMNQNETSVQSRLILWASFKIHN